VSDDDSQTPKKPSAVLRLLQRRSIIRLARILTRMRIQSLAVMAVAGQKLSKWWQTLGSFFSLCWQHLAMPDRTMANVISIVLTAVGVLVVFTKYSVPEVNMTFYGANPFTWKREIIESAMTWIFTAVTLVGLAIQGWAEIFELPTRSHTRPFYLLFTLSSIFMSVLLTLVLTAAGHTIAKRSWLPRVLVWYSGSYNWVDFMLTHKGMSADELTELGKIPKAQQSEYQRNWEQAGGPLNGFRQAERNVTLMEDLLDITPTPGLSLQLRIPGHGDQRFRSIVITIPG
jgi:hypothetical protein